MRVDPTSSLSSPVASNYAGLRFQIAYVSIDQLRSNGDNTRRHSRAQIGRIARSIKKHGFLVPVVIYGDGLIASGNARVEAARLCGLDEVPVVRAEHLSDEQMRLFSIADNKTAEGVEWDFDALRAVFADISMAAPTLDLDGSGFVIAERDIIFGRHRTDEFDDLACVSEQPSPRVVSRIGDRFRLGRHIAVCGDATDPEVIGYAVEGRKVRSVVSDLPYNVKIAGNVSGLGANKHGEFAMASGEMGQEEFTQFLSRSIAAAQPTLVDGALLYLFMDWRHLAELLAAAGDCELAYLNLLVWAKTNAGMGSFYRSAHEMIGVFKHGKEPHLNNVELGRHGRSRTNVLRYPGVNTFSKGRKASLELHPTVKPVALIADLILDSTDVGDIVLDPFGGSGTTLIAAEKTDRTACLVEIDPGYVDVIVNRFERATGQPATLLDTGQTFAEVAAARMEGGA